jgi:hypothetical protein
MDIFKSKPILIFKINAERLNYSPEKIFNLINKICGEYGVNYTLHIEVTY